MTGSDDKIVEMGAVSVETSGLHEIGPLEAQNGTRYFLGGIAAED